MATEDEAIAGTQETLGKLISKPKMTEKYLKKPPFRFLHDIIMEVTRATTFAQGLYATEECDAAQLADKAAKVEFLNKAIAVTSFALGETIDVSANKIVAGLEAEKTNIWLQQLHRAATTCVGAKSDEAVNRVQAGETVGGGAKEKKKKREKEKDEDKPKEDKPKEAPKEDGSAAADDPAAAAAAEEAKKKEEDRKRRAERKKREEEKKRKEEEKAAEAAAKAAAEDGAPEPVDAPAPQGEDDEAAKAAEEEERKRKKDEDRKKREEDKKRREEKKRKQEEEAAAKAAAEAAETEAAAAAQAAAADAAEEERMRAAAAAAAAVDGGAEPFGEMPSAPGSAAQPTRPGYPGGEQDDMASHQGDNMDDLLNRQNLRPERPRTAGRRPPKVVSKVQTSSEQPITGPNVVAPAIISEDAKDDDDEDLFEEEKPENASGLGGVLQAEDGQMHGKLVSNLLAQKKQEEERERLKREEEETRETFEGDGGGIKMGKLKRKKGTAEHQQDVDIVALGGSIQSLCQAANPLGKSIDLVHQDIANMGKELDHWKAEYRQASEQYHQQLKMTEDMLQPLYQKVTELDDKIAEQRTKIRNSRSRISKNDLKVQALLESVVCAK